MQYGGFEQPREKPPVNAMILEVAKQEETPEEVEHHFPSHPA